jgi:hypothetical protein
MDDKEEVKCKDLRNRRASYGKTSPRNLGAAVRQRIGTAYRKIYTGDNGH